MNKNELKSQELIKKSLSLADSLSELDYLIKKLHVLSDNMYDNYIEKINFKTERGKLTAEMDFNIIKVMMDIMCSYIAEASEISKNLPELSNDIFDELKDCS